MIAVALDPVVTRVLAAAVAIVLLVGAWQKLRDVDSFLAALEDYDLLPAGLLMPLARLLPMLEILAGFALVIEPLRVVGAVLALGVLALVTGAVLVNLLRGRRHIGCGCGGVEDEQTLSWSLVGRNGLLAVLVAASAADPSVRTLTWLDTLSVAAGAACLYGVYALANQLLANQPRLARLRSARR